MLYVESCVALYTYTSTVAEDLTFNKGDVIAVVRDDGDWWTGSKDGRTGMFPANYVKKLPPASKVRTNVLYVECVEQTLHLASDSSEQFNVMQ